MSRWLPERGLSRRGRTTVAVDASGFACMASGHVLTGEHSTLAQAIAPLHSGDMLDVIVASDVAVHWLQAVPQSVASLAELRRAAAARCVQLFGATAGGWRVAGDWQTRQPFPCAAFPHSFADRIARAARTPESRIRWSTGPMTALARSGNGLPPQGWTCLRTASTMALWHATLGRIDRLAILRVDPRQGEPEVRRQAGLHIALIHARDGLKSSETIHWVEAPADACAPDSVLAREATSTLRLLMRLPKGLA